jgi:membrane dipeptidase
VLSANDKIKQAEFRMRMKRSSVLVVLLMLLAGNTGNALQHAREILRVTPIVDGHNDLPWVIREKGNGKVEAWDIAARGRGDTDIPRLREGMVGTQFWSVYVSSGLSPQKAMRAQLEQIDIAHRIIGKYPQDLGFAGSVSDVWREHGRGRIASLLGIEGGHTIGNSLGALRAYYALGVRYMTLTHFHSHDWADAATGEALHAGLSPFGVEVVHEMNRLGMMVDLAHVSEDTVYDALDAAKAPVIFSHAAARALVDHSRNVPDSVLRRMPENGGVVMVAFIPQFVSNPVMQWSEELWKVQVAEGTSEAELAELTREYIVSKGAAPRATIADVADHIEHIASVAGHDHVGIGADFYGAEFEYELVQGLEDVSTYPSLFAELVRRGWTDENLRKLAGENLMQAFSKVEQVAARIDSAEPPSTATIE